MFWNQHHYLQKTHQQLILASVCLNVSKCMSFKCISFTRNRLKDLKEFVLPLCRSASQSQVKFCDFLFSLKQLLSDIISKNHCQKFKNGEALTLAYQKDQFQDHFFLLSILRNFYEVYILMSNCLPLNLLLLLMDGADVSASGINNYQVKNSRLYF